MQNEKITIMGLEALLLMEWNEFKGIDLSKLKFLIKRPIVLDTKNITKKKFKYLKY